MQRDDKDVGVGVSGWDSTEQKKYSIVESSEPTEKQKRIREGWLQGKDGLKLDDMAESQSHSVCENDPKAICETVSAKSSANAFGLAAPLNS